MRGEIGIMRGEIGIMRGEIGIIIKGKEAVAWAWFKHNLSFAHATNERPRPPNKVCSKL